MLITRRQLTLAGVISIINAVLISITLVPTALFGVMITGCYTQSCYQTINILVICIGVITIIRHGSYGYIFLALKRLINIQFQFYGADIFLFLAIWLNVLLSGLGLTTINILLISRGFSKSNFGLNGLGWIVLVCLVIYWLAMILLGIVYILIGAEILRFSQNVRDKILESFARTLAFTGWLNATILLAPLGFLLAVQADALLGSIFLRRARNL